MSRFVNLEPCKDLLVGLRLGLIVIPAAEFVQHLAPLVASLFLHLLLLLPIALSEEDQFFLGDCLEAGHISAFAHLEHLAELGL